MCDCFRLYVAVAALLPPFHSSHVFLITLCHLDGSPPSYLLNRPPPSGFLPRPPSPPDRRIKGSSPTPHPSSSSPPGLDPDRLSRTPEKVFRWFDSRERKKAMRGGQMGGAPLPFTANHLFLSCCRLTLWRKRRGTFAMPLRRRRCNAGPSSDPAAVGVSLAFLVDSFSPSHAPPLPHPFRLWPPLFPSFRGRS